MMIEAEQYLNQALDIWEPDLLSCLTSEVLQLQKKEEPIEQWTREPTLILPRFHHQHLECLNALGLLWYI